MQKIYSRKPKIHMLRNGKAVCGRYWLDGEEEGSKFANAVDCKDCLRLLTPVAAETPIGLCPHGVNLGHQACSACDPDNPAFR